MFRPEGASRTTPHLKVLAESAKSNETDAWKTGQPSSPLTSSMRDSDHSSEKRPLASHEPTSLAL
jgi:hypothetical protein